MNKSDIEKLIKYSDNYIAFIDNRFNIIAAGKTMKSVESQLKGKKISNATITYIPPVNKSFTPYVHNN